VKKQALLITLLGLTGLAMGCTQPMMGNKMSANHAVPPLTDSSIPQRGGRCLPS